MQKVFIKTYGCSNNQAESEIMSGILEKNGYSLSDIDSADIVVLNTCTVKSKTENKIVDEIKRLEKSGKKIVVGGCISDANPKLIRKIAPKASIIGTHNITQISSVVEKTLNDERVEILQKKYI